MKILILFILMITHHDDNRTANATLITPPDPASASVLGLRDRGGEANMELASAASKHEVQWEVLGFKA